MGVIFLIVIGGIFGWLASIILRSEGQGDVLVNVGLGVGGALLAGLLVNPMLGGGSLLGDSFSVGALLIALLGSVATLVIVNLLRRQAFH